MISSDFWPSDDRTFKKPCGKSSFFDNFWPFREFPCSFLVIYPLALLIDRSLNELFSRFGHWKKDADDSKKFLEDKLIAAKGETSGNPKADLSALGTVLMIPEFPSSVQ